MQSIDTALKPSKQFIAAIVFVTSISLVAIDLSMIPCWTKLLSGILSLSYGLSILRAQGLLLANHSVLHLRLLTNGSWLFITKNHAVAGELLGDTLSTQFIIILRFIIPGSRKKYSCIICRDSLEPAVYQSLVLHLRCQRIKPSLIV